MGINGHFNKIINIYFLDANGNQTKDKIICPTLGRKPEIEIVGKFVCTATGGSIPAFTITVTNLYINVIEFQYPKIKVEAGYKNNLVSFTGSIISLFQESPGPDGKTVICCYLGSTEKWLDVNLNISFSKGTTLKNVIQNISTSLGFTKSPQIPSALQGLTLPIDFAENGTASFIINKIFNLLPDYKIQINEINNQLYLYSTGKVQTTQKSIEIEYLSSPPQKNPGDNYGAYYVVFTAPWDPAVMPGVTVKFPAWSYIKYLQTVNTVTQTNAAIVQFVEVHFSTIGSVNQMQVQGIGVTNV